FAPFLDRENAESGFPCFLLQQALSRQKSGRQLPELFRRLVENSGQENEAGSELLGDSLLVLLPHFWKHSFQNCQAEAEVTPFVATNVAERLSEDRNVGTLVHAVEQSR